MIENAKFFGGKLAKITLYFIDLVGNLIPDNSIKNRIVGDF